MGELVGNLLALGGPVGAVLVAVIAGFLIGNAACRVHTTALKAGYEGQLAELRREVARLEAREEGR